MFQTSRIRPIKPIFLLWFQGWHRAPRICQLCARSWKLKNPSWQVIQLDCHTLSAWCEWKKSIPAIRYKKISRAAASDIIRLSLLKRFGGIWADATVFCAKSLEEWLPDNTFFAFKNPDSQRSISSWFLAADHDSRLLGLWYDAVIDYWNEQNQADHYFWLHHRFTKLLNENTEFQELWSQAPLHSNIEPHFFHRHGFYGPAGDRVMEHIRTRKAPVYKLTWKKGAIETSPRIKALLKFHRNKIFVDDCKYQQEAR